jgi:hypothetical protein
MQHKSNDNKQSGNAGLRRPYNRESFIAFAAVQRRVQEIRDEITDKVLQDLVVPEGHQAEASLLIASRFAEVELEGVRTVALLRRFRGDEIVLHDWEDLVRRAMVRKLIRLLDEADSGSSDDAADDDDGDGAPVGSSRNDPDLPQSGGLTVVLADDADTVRVAAVGHPKYLATTEDVGRFVYDRALAVTRARVRSWSDDSGEPEAIAAGATLKVLDRYQRLWNPSDGSLVAYLGASIRWAVKDEYILACRRKTNGKSLTEAYERVLADDLRCLTGATDHDPRLDGLGDELEDSRYAERLEILVMRLNPHQRQEFERRRRENTPGTPDQQSTYSRALRNLRRMAA